MLHRVEKLLEQRSFPLGKRGHLFDELCCSHGVILAQLRSPAKWLFHLVRTASVVSVNGQVGSARYADRTPRRGVPTSRDRRITKLMTRH